jgi:hypothetical protein
MLNIDAHFKGSNIAEQRSSVNGEHGKEKRYSCAFIPKFLEGTAYVMSHFISGLLFCRKEDTARIIGITIQKRVILIVLFLKTDERTFASRRMENMLRTSILKQRRAM